MYELGLKIGIEDLEAGEAVSGLLSFHVAKPIQGCFEMWNYQEVA